MGCSGLTLSRSIPSLSDSWRNSAVEMCDSSAALAAAHTANPFEWVGPNLIQESAHVSHHSPP
jgi:hypothetical protein